MAEINIQNAHALVIGIANYLNVSPLPNTVLNDAQEIAAALSSSDFCAYPQENVKLFLDGAATNICIRAELDRLSQTTDANSTVFLYISSHGAHLDAGAYADNYILPFDAQVASYQALAESAISSAELTVALRKIKAGQMIVVLDCCHAGGIGDPKNLDPSGIKAGFTPQYYDQIQAGLRQGRGRAILASSRSNELSWILPDAANSLFTLHLLAGLKGGIHSPDGFVRIFNLFEFLQPKVTADQPRQHPVFKAELEQNFAVALYRNGAKSPEPRLTDGFRYDAYISFTESGDSYAWVWKTLIPRLRAEGLNLAIGGDVEEPGVARVVSMERAIDQSKRILAVLSNAYLQDPVADFQNVLAMTLGIEGGQYRLLPLQIEALQKDLYPSRLRMLVTLDFSAPEKIERSWERLVKALKGPLPLR